MQTNSTIKDQKRSSVSEVAADWNELMIPQCVNVAIHASANKIIHQRCSQ